MPIRAIRITGDPVLHHKASPVTIFDQNLRDLVQDMFETMDEAPGVGLAAPQIGVDKQIFVYDWDDEDGNPQRGVVINPTLELSGLDDAELEPEAESEGCLSIPGERFPLRRYQKATLRGVDLDQKPVLIHAEGWFARIFQHEFDHLNGVLYVDRLSEPYKEQSSKVIIERGWGEPGHSWLPGEERLEG